MAVRGSGALFTAGCGTGSDHAAGSAARGAAWPSTPAPDAALLRASGERGRTAGERRRKGAVTETRLTNGARSLMARLTELDRVYNPLPAAHHESRAADVPAPAAPADQGRRP
ncbi:hypothetical protein [Streptomyces sp. NPDC097619]|uniref:hypothetical protein n=1 Tax=Streptomyces sp. NPDC097619 TaxID=3157228 RepID=UPI0033237BE3